MSSKGIFTILGAVVVGIVAFWLVAKIVSFVIGFGYLLVIGGLVGGAGYLAYRKFISMASSGKRLT